MRFTVDRLDHLVLNVRDVEITASWYQRVLGMEREEFGRDQRTALKFGGQKINVRPVQSDPRRWPTAQTAAPGSADLCFVTAVGPEDVIEHLRACGISVSRGRSRKRARLARCAQFIAAIPTATWLRSPPTLRIDGPLRRDPYRLTRFRPVPRLRPARELDDRPYRHGLRSRRRPLPGPGRAGARWRPPACSRSAPPSSYATLCSAVLGFSGGWPPSPLAPSCRRWSPHLPSCSPRPPPSCSAKRRISRSTPRSSAGRLVLAVYFLRAWRVGGRFGRVPRARLRQPCVPSRPGGRESVGGAGLHSACPVSLRRVAPTPA